MENVTTQHLDVIVSSLEKAAGEKKSITYDDVNGALSMSRVTPDDIEYIFSALASKGIAISKKEGKDGGMERRKKRKRNSAATFS